MYVSRRVTTTNEEKKTNFDDALTNVTCTQTAATFTTVRIVL